MHSRGCYRWRPFLLTVAAGPFTARSDDVHTARAWQHQQRLLAWVRGDKFMQCGQGRAPAALLLRILKEGVGWEFVKCNTREPSECMQVMGRGV